MLDMYIASCEENGGIYHYEIDGTHIEKRGFVPLDRPMYMEIKENRLYCVLCDPEHTGNSGIVSFRVAADGGLEKKSPIISTLGVEGCHLTATEKGVFCANYGSGSVFRTPDLLVVHSGKGAEPERQEMPHTHSTVLTPDGNYICVCDLGVDTIYLYDLDCNLAGRVRLPDGAGPRHVVFSDDGAYMYCVTELSNQIFCYAYHDGNVEFLQSITTLPQDFAGGSAAAAIRIQGDYLYVSNRGHNSIAVYQIHSGELSLLEIVPCGGNWPRDFNLWEQLLVCTNEKSNDVTFFALQEGLPKRLAVRLEIPRPLNVIFRERT